MKYSKDKTSLIRFRINVNIKNEFENFCKNNNYLMSERMRLLIERDIKNG